MLIIQSDNIVMIIKITFACINYKATADDYKNSMKIVIVKIIFTKYFVVDPKVILPVLLF